MNDHALSHARALSSRSGTKLDFDFCLVSLRKMEQCIKFWLEEYEKKYYVRFAVISKSENQAVGTVEIFGGEAGVLRIDLAKEFSSGIRVS